MITKVVKHTKNNIGNHKNHQNKEKHFSSFVSSFSEVKVKLFSSKYYSPGSSESNHCTLLRTH